MKKSVCDDKTGLLYIEKDKREQYENDLTVTRWKEYRETGETISNAAMTKWLVPWGTDQEKPCPEFSSLKLVNDQLPTVG